MKKFVYIALIIILGSFVFNFITFDYKLGIFHKFNLPYIIGIGAGVCGVILCMILLKYYRLKGSLVEQSNKE